MERTARQKADWVKFSGNLDERRCGYLLFTVFAEHGEEPEFCGLRQKLVMAFKPGLLIRQFQMNVEILPSSPIFVEVKDVRIFFADVKVIVNAASLGPRTINKTAQKFDQFCTFFWSGVQSSCEGATWFHNFVRLPFHHGAKARAIWFFHPERGGASIRTGLKRRDAVEPRMPLLKGLSSE
jgi:hypothetical protein